MSSSASNNSIPRFIEPRKFSSMDVRLCGTIPESELKRLMSTASLVKSVYADLHFYIDEEGRSVAAGCVKAEVAVQCQRCLDLVTKELDSKVLWAMVWDDADEKALPVRYDPWVVGAEQVDLYSMIEEELLLEIPVVAYHDEMCIDKTQFASSVEDASGTESETTNNPFREALGGLKSSLKEPK